jgi:hypothetical protein
VEIAKLHLHNLHIKLPSYHRSSADPVGLNGTHSGQIMKPHGKRGRNFQRNGIKDGHTQHCQSGVTLLALYSLKNCNFLYANK